MARAWAHTHTHIHTYMERIHAIWIYTHAKVNTSIVRKPHVDHERGYHPQSTRRFFMRLLPTSCPHTFAYPLFFSFIKFSIFSRLLSPQFCNYFNCSRSIFFSHTQFLSGCCCHAAHAAVAAIYKYVCV